MTVVSIQHHYPPTDVFLSGILFYNNSPGIGITTDEVTICVAPGCGSTLVLDSTQLEGCLTAVVEDDNIVDDPESFTIFLSTTQPRVNVENMVTFEVIDNDGRSLV